MYLYTRILLDGLIFNLADIFYALNDHGKDKQYQV